MRYLLLFVFSVVSVWGQFELPPIIRIPFVGPQIQAYLGLTREQVSKIVQQINDHERWVASRQRRMNQVQMEIAEETGKSPLDPMALGVRYAEVEAIRREIAERVSRLVPENVAVLTDVQKVKLKALEEALKLASTGSEARNLRLLPEECGVPRLGLPVSSIVIVDPAGGYFGGSTCTVRDPFPMSPLP